MSGILLLLLVVAFFARRGRMRGATKESLPVLLAGAEEAGIITAIQREQLLAYARAHEPANARLAGATWLAVCAGLFVVAGVSLLVARNWEEFGPLVRVTGFLAALLAVGEGSIRTRERSFGLSVPLELLWFFLPLLGFGLYAQTFQLSGDPIPTLLAWLAMTAPLAWLSPRPVVATIHTFAMIGVLFGGNYLLEPASVLLAGGGGRSVGLLTLTEAGGRPVAWALSIILLGAISMQSLWLLPRTHRHHFIGVWAVWVLSLLVAPTPLRLQHEGWLILAALALGTLWIVVLAQLQTSVEERAGGMLVWLAMLYALTFTWHMHRVAAGPTTQPGLALAVLLVVSALASVLLLPRHRLSPLPAWDWAAKAVLVTPILVALLYLGEHLESAWLAAAIMNVVLVVVAVGLMWHGSLVHEVAQINLGVLVLVGVLITRFLDLFASMLQSGIGFIVAGALLALLSWALDRARRRLIGRPVEMLP